MHRQKFSLASRQELESGVRQCGWSGVRQCGWSGVRVCGGLSGVLGLTGAGAGERWSSGATGDLRGDSGNEQKMSSVSVVEI
jgi:hypothetical protein